MIQQIRSVLEQLRQHHPLILVSILASSGSVPRGAGAMMLVFRDGHTQGTIGGGSIEYAAVLHAKDLLKTGSCDTVGYQLNQQDISGLGMICGGNVTVYFQYLSGDTYLLLFESLYKAFSGSMATWLIRKIEHHTVTAMTVCDESGFLTGDPLDSSLLSELLKTKAVYLKGEPSYYAEPVTHAGTVYIFGGGHVSRELTSLLAHVGFPVVIFEDREEFASPALFPDARKVILGSFINISEHLTLTRHDYVVIMTRGHQADFEVLSQVLRYPCTYIGCIGSRKKISATRQRLTEIGFPEDAFDRVHAPIGLPIKAETPAEIAVSVAAELIKHRAEISMGE